MQIRNLADVRWPSEPTISPDGSLVVYVRMRIDLDDDAYRSELWAVPANGSAAPRKLTLGPRDVSPTFSPDGRWLAFLRGDDGEPPQLHVIPVDGGEPREVCHHPLGAATPAWSPDSTRIAYVARVPEQGRYGTDDGVTPEKEPPRRITKLRYRLDDIGFINDRRPHVFVVDPHAEGAQPVQLTQGDFNDGGPTWSPDGTEIAFVSARHEERDWDLRQDVFVVPAGGGSPRRVTDNSRPVAHRIAYSPGGGTLYFAAHEGPDLYGRTVGLFSVPADGSSVPRRLTDEEDVDLGHVAAPHRMPLLADEEAVTTVSLRRGAVELVRFPLDGSEPETLVGGRRAVEGYARAGALHIVVVADATSAGEVLALRDGDAKTLTEHGADLAQAADLRPMQEITTKAPDGYPVHGWVVKPSGDGPFPTLLCIHGGPHAQYEYRLFDEAQVYAGAGYAVVLGNPRGSAGYGNAHGRAVIGNLGGPDEADLLALLDAALEDPALDRDRVGIMGGSYGGFMTAWITAHHHRFRGAIVDRGFLAPDSFVGSSDIGWLFVDGYLGADPERQAAQSPLAKAKDVRTPTLIIHSEQDWRCPVEQGQRYYVELQRNGVDSELLLFPGEGHELSRSGLPSHRVARFEAILDWWDRYL